MSTIEQEFKEEHESKYSHLAKLVFAYLLFAVGFYVAYAEQFGTPFFISLIALLSLLTIAAGALILRVKEEEVIKTILLVTFLLCTLAIIALIVYLAGSFTIVFRQLTAPAFLAAIIMTLVIGLAGGIYYGLRETVETEMKGKITSPFEISPTDSKFQVAGEGAVAIGGDVAGDVIVEKDFPPQDETEEGREKTRGE